MALSTSCPDYGANNQGTTLCRLCVNICNDCKSLFDENGSSNSIYETTVKYFDPMLLNLEQEKTLTVICLECWRHISEFHEFQQSVLQAQTKLAEDIKQIEETVVKTEEDFLFNQIYEKPKDSPAVKPSVDGVGACETNDTTDDNKDDINIPDLEFLDADHDDEFSTDDEKPLLECVAKMRKKRKVTVKKEKSTKATKDLINNRKKVPRKRGRRPKNKCESDSKVKVAEGAADTSKDDDKCNSTIASLNEDISNDNANHSSNCDSDDNQGAGKTVFKNDAKTRQRSKEIDDFIAQWKQDLECVVCSETYPNLTLLRKHFRENHPKQKCYISCCQRKLRHRFHIEEHIRFHIDPAAFKCNECGKCCTNSRTLNNHKLEKHTEGGQQRSFECPICQKCFAKKTVLKCHIETHKTGTDYVCSECGKGFPTEQRRKVHERTVHNVDRVCDQCGKTIHGIYALKQHLLEHAGIQKPKWPCDICNAQLYSHSSLKRHKQVAHHDGSTVYVCSECGKIAATETALRSHKKYVHQAERKHKCTICDKAFKVAVVLREHMATHTGEDLYTCPHCPRTFKVSSNMHHHRKKAHPKEWAEGRLNRPIVAKVDVNQVSHEVVL